MTYFTVAGLQLILAGNNNLDLIRREISSLKKRAPAVQMVMLGELSLFGANPEHAVVRGGDVEQALCAIARENKIWFVPGSFYQRDGDRIYNMAPVINPEGEIISRYRKIFPFCPYEAGITPGDEFVCFDVPGVGRFGVLICYDMWFPETTRTLVSAGAAFILHPTMTNSIDRDAELAIARANAAVNQCYFMDINVAGDYGVGKSIVCGPGGEVIHQAGSGREIILIDVDIDHVRTVRERGWHGTGQVLKSFRDNKVPFPVYRNGGNRADYLKSLGRLKKPDIRE
ncbi:MAG: carbon-nitrogen hydrolase family protein [Alphaproteobacteria bacterium]|nr:carbon-nitrogen hydrolase family protein [Alphaproteobacteria bacterium]